MRVGDDCEKIWNYDYRMETLIWQQPRKINLNPCTGEGQERGDGILIFVFQNFFWDPLPFPKGKRLHTFPSCGECSEFRRLRPWSHATGLTTRQAAGGGPDPALSKRKPPDVVHTHEVYDLVSWTTKPFGTDWQSLWNQGLNYLSWKPLEKTPRMGGHIVLPEVCPACVSQRLQNCFQCYSWPSGTVLLYVHPDHHDTA